MLLIQPSANPVHEERFKGGRRYDRAIPIDSSSFAVEDIVPKAVAHEGRSGLSFWKARRQSCEVVSLLVQTGVALANCWNRADPEEPDFGNDVTGCDVIHAAAAAAIEGRRFEDADPGVFEMAGWYVARKMRCRIRKLEAFSGRHDHHCEDVV